jgi:cytoskeletal protein CcmA (bactofilin family)
MQFLSAEPRIEDCDMADLVDGLSIPVKSAPPTPVIPPRTADLPRPGADPARPPASHDPAVDQVAARTLIVGPEIVFSGDVTSCEQLIIEGSIEVNLQNCQTMTIAETGIFRGNGSTENADVRGRVEGDLVVHKRLLIRASGHVSGTITYGEIEIEAGGKISGVIQAHERPKGLGIRRS